MLKLAHQTYLRYQTFYLKKSESSGLVWKYSTPNFWDHYFLNYFPGNNNQTITKGLLLKTKK